MTTSPSASMPFAQNVEPGPPSQRPLPTTPAALPPPLTATALQTRFPEERRTGAGYHQNLEFGEDVKFVSSKLGKYAALVAAILTLIVVGTLIWFSISGTSDGTTRLVLGFSAAALLLTSAAAFFVFFTWKCDSTAHCTSLTRKNEIEYQNKYGLMNDTRPQALQA